MRRPLSTKGTEELIRLFEERRNSIDGLRELADELSHRERPKAVHLRAEVDEAIRGLAATQSTRAQEPRRPSNSPSNGKNRPSNAPEGSSDEGRRTTYRDPLSPPDEFTVIQPLGVKGRPSAYQPPMQNDVKLAVGRSDPAAKVFRVALFELIAEMKRERKNNQQFTLEDGERMGMEPGGFSYQFEFTDEANLFEGARIDLIVGGKKVGGNLTGLYAGRIIVTVQEDFGELIRTCILRIDSTALLQALHDRLQKIERGEVQVFRADFAARVLDNNCDVRPAVTTFSWPWNDPPPNAQQRSFVGTAMGNEISWLWGPPGTGKTATLSALVWLLYNAGKRVLICSNTNKAVDQLLLKLCEKMRDGREPALTEGRVLRLGRIGENDELERSFSDFITIDSIVSRKSEALIRRKAEVESELERMGREIAFAEDVLRRFAALDSADFAVAAAEQEHSRRIQKANGSSAAFRAATERESGLQKELQDFRNAGAFRRILMRNEAVIQQDITVQKNRIELAMKQAAEDNRRVEEQRAFKDQCSLTRNEASAAVAGEDHVEWQRVVREYDERRQPLRDELAAIASQLEDIRNSVLSEARIVGATVTRTYLRPLEFAAFDAVIIDEASMILLPAVFHAAGLATGKVVVAGDFQQLPPIVQTQQEAIHEILAPDIFFRAGITAPARQGREIPRLVLLDEQFRMDYSICRLVSGRFYQGRLRTSPKRTPVDTDWLPDLLSSHLTIIDTSHVWPFATRNTFNSRFNLMHALAIRNLVLHLTERGCLTDTEGKGNVGLCSPYAAQSKLLHEILKARGLAKTVRASTVHGFQGDERALIILDLVDSVGERNAGFFLQANHLDASGAKLLNVALSRAREEIVVVANLTFLDAKLPGDAILRDVLHEIQRVGRIVDVRDVLALHPIVEDLKRFGSQPELDPETLRTGLFHGRDFARFLRLDLDAAKESVAIFSGFITEKRAAQMGDLLRAKIADGVRVRCVTRPPRYNGTIPEAEGRAALRALESIGVTIDLRNEIHEKIVLIDRHIAWHGSLNPLSHTIKTSEIMFRSDDEGFAIAIERFMSIHRTPDDNSNAGGTVAENPRCEKCGGWTVLIRGKFGLFFACEAGSKVCDWKQNVDAPRHRRTTN